MILFNRKNYTSINFSDQALELLIQTTGLGEPDLLGIFKDSLHRREGNIQRAAFKIAKDNMNRKVSVETIRIRAGTKELLFKFVLILGYKKENELWVDAIVVI